MKNEAEKEKKERKDPGQLTHFMDPDDKVEVASGACKVPYKCSQCQHRRHQRVPDPERKGLAYKTASCDRPNRTTEIAASDWLRAEVERIGGQGRKVEVRNQVLDDGTKMDRVALFLK